MKKVALIPLFVLIGCSTQVFYYQDNALKSQVTADLGACVKEAAEAAPVDRVFIREPGFFETRQICNGDDCVTEKFFVRGDIRTYDANAGLRARLERACMAEKGYERLEFQRCKQAKAVDASLQTRLPTAATVSCFVRDDTGRVAFIEN